MKVAVRKFTSGAAQHNSNWYTIAAKSRARGQRSQAAAWRGWSQWSDWAPAEDSQVHAASADEEVIGKLLQLIKDGEQSLPA